MQVTSASSIRAKLLELPDGALEADTELTSLLSSPLKTTPKLKRVDNLLKALAKRDVDINEAAQILGLSQRPAGTEWYDGQNGVLVCIDLWADDKKTRLDAQANQPTNLDQDSSAANTTQPSPADEAAAAQAAAAAFTPTLLAASSGDEIHSATDTASTVSAACGDDTVSASSTEPVIDGNVVHAFIMLRLAGKEPPDNERGCWEMWCSERDKWRFVGHTFHTQLQPDTFNKSPHVKNVLTYKLGTNGPEAPMGPDDARGLFTHKRDEIDSIVGEKFRTRRDYQRKASEILRLINLFDGAEREPIRTLLAPMIDDIENIGDGNFNTIDGHYKRMEEHWNRQCSTNYTPHDFLRAFDNIQNVCQDLTDRECDLGRFQNSINRINASGIIPFFAQGGIPNNEEHTGLLITTYKDLLQYQKDMPETFGLAHKRRVSEPLDRVYGTHRGEGGLFVLRFLIDNNPNTNNLRILDFCGNGVLWTVAGHMLQDGLPISQNNVVDLERNADSALFESNPNPNRFLANLSNITTPVRENGTASASEKYRAVVLNFVLNHFTDDLDAMKEAVIAAREFLQAAPADTANIILNDSNVRDLPLFVVLLPESCQLERSPLNDILRSSGLVPYMQLKGENEVQDGRYQTIRGQRGKDIADGVQSRVRKPYKIHIYALVDNRDFSSMRLADREAYELVKTNGNAQRGPGTNGEDEGELKAPRIQKNIATGNLRAQDIVLPSNRSIPSSVIINDPRYSDFEVNLATLIEFRQFLHPKDQARLDEIEQLWYWKFVPAIAEENVAFVMQRPSHARIQYPRLPDHLRTFLHQQQPQSDLTEQIYSFADLGRVENTRRQSLSQFSLIDQYRLNIVSILRTLYDMNWKKHGPEIQSELDANLLGNTLACLDQVGGILNSFCLSGTRLEVDTDPSKMDTEFRTPLFTCQLRGQVELADPAGPPGKSIGRIFIIAPNMLFRPCDISSRLRHDATINERIEAHQANANLTDDGFQYFLEREAGVKVAPNFVQQLKSVQRKTISRETAELIAKVLGTSPEDILPSYTT